VLFTAQHKAASRAETSGLLQEIDDVWLAAHFVEHIASTDGALRSSTQTGRELGREPWRGCSRASAAARHGRGLRQRGEEGRAAAVVESLLLEFLGTMGGRGGRATARRGGGRTASSARQQEERARGEGLELVCRPWKLKGAPWEGACCCARKNGVHAMAAVRGRRQGGEAMAAGKMEGWECKIAQVQERGTSNYRHGLGLGFFLVGQMGWVGLGPKYESGLR
jgi:hypothetical protein